MKPVKNCYTGLVLTGMITACSGGGGSDDSPVPSAPTSAAVVITPANASKVSAEAYGSTVSTSSLGFSGLSGGGITAAVVSSDQDSFDLFEFTRQQIARLPEISAPLAGDTLSAIIISAATENCVGGGEVTVSGEVATLETPTAGDTLNIELSNCAANSGALSGQLSMQFNSVSGDPLSENFGFDVTLTMANFSVAQSGVTSTGNGDITVAIRNLSNGESEASLTGNSLTLTEGSTTSTLSGFSIVETLNRATGTSATNSRGTLESTEIDGSVSYNTPVPFQAIDGEFPFVGTLTITGADGSSLQFVSINSVEVRLDIDADGDNSFEESIETTWAALEQL